MAAKKKVVKEETIAQKMKRWEKEAKVKIAKQDADKKAFAKKVKKPKDTPAERLKKLEEFVFTMKWRLDRYKRKDECFFPEDVAQDLKDVGL